MPLISMQIKLQEANKRARFAMGPIIGMKIEKASRQLGGKKSTYRREDSTGGCNDDDGEMQLLLSEASQTHWPLFVSEPKNESCLSRHE